MKKTISLIISILFSIESFAQTKLEITQTNPLSNILSYNMDYIIQSQKLLNHHQHFMQRVSNSTPIISYLQLDDTRGAKVIIVSNLEMPVLQASLIRFDNQQLKYIINTEKTNQLLNSSCINIQNFINQEPLKINSILSSNLEMILNISLKDGYKIHVKYVC